LLDLNKEPYGQRSRSDVLSCQEFRNWIWMHSMQQIST